MDLYRSARPNLVTIATYQALHCAITGEECPDIESFGEWDDMLRLIRERLTHIGAVDRRKVYLSSTPHLDKMLISSVNKMESIADIVRLEHGALGTSLRMIILTDFIRKSEMPDSPEDVKPLTHLGAVPIFEKIRRDCPDNIKLGILTGSYVVVPLSSEQLLRKLCAEHGIEDQDVNLLPLFHDKRYCRLIIERDLRNVVEIITRLFSEGGSRRLWAYRSGIKSSQTASSEWR